MSVKAVSLHTIRGVIRVAHEAPAGDEVNHALQRDPEGFAGGSGVRHQIAV